MRVVVTGATGNVGTALLHRLASDERVSEVVGVARRRPELQVAKVEWMQADVASDELARLFEGADALVHLAWLFQPTHRPMVTWRSNVIGTKRTLGAAGAAGVPIVIHASSIGAYSPGPGLMVAESWPTHSVPHAAYGREKAYAERLLDTFELRHPKVRVVRMRPAFIFQQRSATEQRRIFAGPLLPGRLVQPGVLPFVPFPAGLRFQAMDSDDAAEAYRLALHADVRGPFNLAADGVLDSEAIGRLLRTRVVSVPPRAMRAALALAWRSHLVPADPALLDLVLELPLLDTTKARTELDWHPRLSGIDALSELLDGLRAGAGSATPPLEPDSLAGRSHEVLSAAAD